MFKNEFQGGPYFELFSAQGQNSAAIWKSSGTGAKKEFDKEVRSFVYVITATTKIHIPRDSKLSLTLVQRYLILQLCIPKGQDFSVDLGVSDLNNQKRRLVLSTTHKDIQVNPLHSKIPLGFMKRSKWLNLCLDMSTLVGGIWQGQTYKCLDNVCIAGHCRIRRIFTMKQQPLDTTDDEELYGFTGTNNGIECDRIPKPCQLALDIPQDVQVINFTKIRHYEGRSKCGESVSRSTSQQDLDLSSSGGKKSGSQDGYHIAFGTKVAQPRKGSGKEGSSTSRHPKSMHNRSKSDVGTDGVRVSQIAVDGLDDSDTEQFVKPHPPREPSSEKRRRPRVKSAGKNGSSHHILKDDASSAGSSMNSSHGSSQSRSNSGNQATRINRYQQPEVVANDDEVEDIMHEMRSAMKDRSETESEPSSHNTSGLQDVDPDSMDQDSLSEVIQALKDQHNLDTSSQDSVVDTEDSEEERSTLKMNEDLYTFVSKPKLVPHGHDMVSTAKFPTKQRTRKRSDPSHRKYMNSHRKTGSNSATNSSDDDTDMTPWPSHSSHHRKTSPPQPKKDIRSKQPPQPTIDTGNHPAFRNSGLLQVVPQMARSPHNSQNRMSVNRKSLREITNEEWRKSVNQQPYNVNKYTTIPNKVASVTDSFEERMLASLQREMMESGTSEDDKKTSSNLDQYNTKSLNGFSDEEGDRSTLKETLQPSSHNYQDEMKILSQEFLSQSNPRDWGNVFSPPIIQNLEQGKQPSEMVNPSGVAGKESCSDNDDMLDLLYDPVLNCYYDPVSCKYYELV